MNEAIEYMHSQFEIKKCFFLVKHTMIKKNSIKNVIETEHTAIELSTHTHTRHNPNATNNNLVILKNKFRKTQKKNHKINL